MDFILAIIPSATEVMEGLPPLMVERTYFLIKTVGILAVVYFLFSMVGVILSYFRNRRIKDMHLRIKKIEKKLDLIIRNKSKKKK